MTAMKVVPVARLCINRFDGTVIARTWDECSKGLYPDRWDEGDDLYTLKEAKAALSAVEPAPDGLVERSAWGCDLSGLPAGVNKELVLWWEQAMRYHYQVVKAEYPKDAQQAEIKLRNHLQAIPVTVPPGYALVKISELTAPLLTAPVAALTSRAAVLEEAAKICERRAEQFDADVAYYHDMRTDMGYRQEAQAKVNAAVCRNDAQAIRAAKGE